MGGAIAVMGDWNCADGVMCGGRGWRDRMAEAKVRRRSDDGLMRTGVREIQDVGGREVALGRGRVSEAWHGVEGIASTGKKRSVEGHGAEEEEREEGLRGLVGGGGGERGCWGPENVC